MASPPFYPIPKRLGWLLALLPALLGCGWGAQRKSARYYEDHQAEIRQMQRLYDSLHQQQSFSIGFTSASQRQIVLEVETDTVRYIFNTRSHGGQLYPSLLAFGYDTLQMARLQTAMKQLKCLWLDKASFILEGQKAKTTLLSFRSRLTHDEGIDTKYYILILPDQPISPAQLKRANIRDGTIVPISEDVFFTIGRRFR